jgi:hypothetical protein
VLRLDLRRNRSKYRRASSSIGGGNGVGKLASGDQERAEEERGVDLGRGQQTLGGPIARSAARRVSSSAATAAGCCFGLALGRRALAMSLAEPSRFEVRLRFENSELDLGRPAWTITP